MPHKGPLILIDLALLRVMERVDWSADYKKIKYNSISMSFKYYLFYCVINYVLFGWKTLALDYALVNFVSQSLILKLNMVDILDPQQDTSFKRYKDFESAFIF